MTTFIEPSESPISVAVAQRESGDIHGAIETLRSAAQGALGDARLAVTLAQMLAETEQTERAERWFRHALKLAPDDLYVRMGFGTFLGQTGHVARAREVLEGVRREMRDGLADPEGETEDSLSAMWSFIGCTEINLGRAAFESGDSCAALALVNPWLADEEHWSEAHDVMTDVVERDDLDATLVAEGALASGHVSPFMVHHLIELALDAEPCDFGKLDRIIGRANACFEFDWKRVDPALVSVLARARRLFARAVMRGAVLSADHPRLAALAKVTRSRRRRAAFARPR